MLYNTSMNKITFSTGPGSKDILLNGVVIGHMTGGREVWVEFGNHEFVARFKYRSPMVVAKYTIRELLKRRTPEEILAKVKAGVYAGTQLQELGIPHYWATKEAR